MHHGYVLSYRAASVLCATWNVYCKLYMVVMDKNRLALKSILKKQLRDKRKKDIKWKKEGNMPLTLTVNPDILNLFCQFWFCLFAASIQSCISALHHESSSSIRAWPCVTCYQCSYGTLAVIITRPHTTVNSSSAGRVSAESRVIWSSNLDDYFPYWCDTISTVHCLMCPGHRWVDGEGAYCQYCLPVSTPSRRRAAASHTVTRSPARSRSLDRCFV